jgi:hypothetical protein
LHISRCAQEREYDVRIRRELPLDARSRRCSVGTVSGVVGKPKFSFGEMLVLLDIEGAGAISTPVPTVAEAAALVGNAVRGTPPCVEVHGACKFRTGLAHLYDPPHADLVVTPANGMLSITRVADVDTWTSMFEWVTGYFSDTLTTRGAPRDGYLEYAGQGVVATIAYTRPGVRLDARDAAIEVAVRHDEPALATVHRLFGVANEVTIAPPDDGNWRELATSWPLHLACSRQHDTVRLRMTAPHHDGQISTANLCEEWCCRWLDMCAATGIGHHDRGQVSWDLHSLGRASIVRGTGAHRRDEHELHIPLSWLAPPPH